MLDAGDQEGNAELEMQEDPVCGMSVRPDAPLRVEHAGETYVFCSEGCLRRFKDAPLTFVRHGRADEESAAKSRI